MFNVAKELPQYGDLDLGFYGETDTAELINGEELAVRCRLNEGVLRYSDEPWLKYVMDGEVRYVAKRPYRSGISWRNLDSLGLVEGRLIKVRGKDYLVRLMQGATITKFLADGAGFDCKICQHSEWNRLFYRIHSTIHTEPNNNTVSEGSPTPWVSYSDADLMMSHFWGYGHGSWTQETRNIIDFSGIVRGYCGVSHVDYTSVDNDNGIFGWRPVLVPVE